MAAPHDIFISYERSDRAQAKELEEFLKQQGWSVWLDDRIRAGEAWEKEIEQTSRTSRCIVVLWSPRSVRSRWVNREARWGKERGVLVPALIGAVDPPFEFEEIQAADLVEWKAARASGFADLVEVLRTRLSRTAAVGAAVAAAPSLPARVVLRPPPVAAPPETKRFNTDWLDADNIGCAIIVAVFVAAVYFAYRAVPFSQLPDSITEWNAQSPFVSILLALLIAAGIIRLGWYFADDKRPDGVVEHTQVFLKTAAAAAALSVPYLWLFHKSDGVPVIAVPVFWMATPLVTVIAYAAAEDAIGDLPEYFLAISSIGVPCALLAGWATRYVSAIQIPAVADSMLGLADALPAVPLILTVSALVAIVLLTRHFAKEDGLHSAGDYVVVTAQSSGAALSVSFVYLWLFAGVIPWPETVPTVAVALATSTLFVYAIRD